MRNLPIIIGIAAACSAFASELPICEEFAGESHIQCVSTDKAAVVISTFADAVQYEFYSGDRKGYILVDGGVIANTAQRHLKVASIPSENKDAYIQEVMDAVMDDIRWEQN